jgi:hypothetical protein
MNESCMDYSVRWGGSTAQAFQVLQNTEMNPGAGGDERFGDGIRACEAEHLMARANQLSNDRRTENPVAPVTNTFILPPS